MTIHIRRREFIGMLGGAAAWPLAARAQAEKVTRIGFLGAATASGYANQLAGFRFGLHDLGYIEGTNIIVEYRWAEGNYGRLPALVRDLIHSKVNLIVTHGTPATLAAKKATAILPIVAAIIGDPVATGVVASVARPGGNITGQSFFSPELNAKRVELLKEVMPHLTRIGILVNPDNPISIGPESQAEGTAAQSLNVGLQQFPVRGTNEFESAFETMEQGHVQAVLVTEEGVFNANVTRIAALANKRRFLSIGSKDFAQVGGLIGYGIDFFAVFRRAAVFVDKILKGSKPADIPIEQASKFEFVLNLKTAKVIEVEIPTSILLRADTVIE
jgi:putative ABC transport system substrate-binding protein